MSRGDMRELAREQETKLRTAQVLEVLARDDERVGFLRTDRGQRNERIVADEDERCLNAEVRSDLVDVFEDFGKLPLVDAHAIAEKAAARERYQHERHDHQQDDLADGDAVEEESEQDDRQRRREQGEEQRASFARHAQANAEPAKSGLAGAGLVRETRSYEGARRSDARESRADPETRRYRKRTATLPRRNRRPRA